MSAGPFNPSEHPHRRFNPLTGQHVLVSPHRTKRPWKGQVDPPKTVMLPVHEKECYLCPGNARTSGEKNPDFETTFVFPNDFPALLAPPLPQMPEAAPSPSAPTDFFQSTPTFGSCRVLTYAPQHNLTLSLMSVPAIQSVIDCWTSTYLEEGERIRSGHKQGGTEDEGCVTIFENRGSMMGASAPHPHGQVWSTSFVPQESLTELKHMTAYRDAHASNLLLDYAQQEVAKNERVVELDEAGGWVAVVPFWAVWPFEILLLPYKRQVESLASLEGEEKAGLARILKKTLIRYDNLFQTPFPYSMGIHQRPLPSSGASDGDSPAHLHFHFYPPLLRSASVRKFLVGFEMMAESQRDLTPEQAAQRLRDLSDVHYMESKLEEAAKA